VKENQPLQNINSPGKTWASRLDTIGAVSGAALPIGLVIGSTGFELAIGVGILCWLVRSLIAGKESFRRIFSHPFFLPLIAWHLSILLSLVWNGPGSKGWGHDVAILRIGLFVFAMLDISQRKPVVKWMVRGLACAVGFAAVNLVAVYLFGHDLIGNTLADYSNKLREAGRISAINAYAAPLFLWWGISDKTLGKKERGLMLAVGGVAFVHLIQTRIRTAILAVVCGMVFLIYRRFRDRIPLWTVLCVITGLFTATAWILASNYKTLNLFSMYDRVYFWKVSIAMWKSHPWVGVGVSAWMDAYHNLAKSGAIAAFTAPDGTVWHTKEVYHAHNLPLMLLSATGIPGILSFTWLYVRATKCVLSRQTGFRAGMVAWPVVILVIGLTGFNIYSSSYLALFAFLLVTMGSNGAAIKPSSDT
jgi:O-antigen ligase